MLVDVVCADRSIARAFSELLVHLSIAGYRAPESLSANIVKINKGTKTELSMKKIIKMKKTKEK